MTEKTRKRPPAKKPPTGAAPNFEQLGSALKALNYQWFENGNYNLNLVGVRTADNKANNFNDWLCVAFYTDGNPHLFCFPATTDPGLFYRANPLCVDGTAVVKPGQYPGLWTLGMHRGKYSALVQAGPITVYRDNNRDDVVDGGGEEQTGMFGINCHRAAQALESHQVDKWSAGCQVLANPLDFALLINLCRLAAIRYGNRFTYTLLREDEL